MKKAGMALELLGAAAIIYALYSVHLWLGILAAGVFILLAGAGLGATK